MKRPTCILYDLWNTLVSSSIDRDSGIDRLLETVDNPNQVDREMVKTCADDLIESIEIIRCGAMIEFSRRQFDRNLFDRLGIICGRSDDVLDLEFIENTLDPMPEPGVKDQLRKFADRGIKIGVVSNSILGGAALETILEKHRLLEHFDFVMSSTDYGFRKPHPQLFITALALAGASTDETWFIGDSLSIDVAGARNAGLVSVWYNPSGSENPGNGYPCPDFEIRRHREIEKLLSGSSA